MKPHHRISEIKRRAEWSLRMKEKHPVKAGKVDEKTQVYMTAQLKYENRVGR